MEPANNETSTNFSPPQFNVVKRQEIQKLSKIHIYRFIRRRNSRTGTLVIIDSWYKVKIISKIQQLQLSKAEATCKRVGQSGLTGHQAMSRPQRHRLDGLSSQGLKGGSLGTPGVHFFKKPLDAIQKASERFSIRVLHHPRVLSEIQTQLMGQIKTRHPFDTCLRNTS